MFSSPPARALVLSVPLVLASAPCFAVEVERLPYHGVPVELPGRIEAEEYDIGDEGTVSHDTTIGNSGGGLRTDDVDVEVAVDVGGGYNVGWIEEGEWLEYTVNCETGGLFLVRCRVSSETEGGSMHLEIGGNTISSPITFGSTAGWQNWITYGAAVASIPQGESRIRLFFDGAAFNVNWIEFEPAGSCPPLAHEGHESDADGDGFSDDIEAFYGSGISDGSSKPRLGDLNGDGTTNLHDALLMWRHTDWPQRPVDCHVDPRLDGSVGKKGALMLRDWSLGGRQHPIIPSFEREDEDKGSPEESGADPGGG